MNHSHAKPSSSKSNQPPAVMVSDLYVTRGQTAILQGIDCTLPAGQCIALLGPNGCGKTTLTKCLTGHMFITQGQVTVLGQTIGQTDVRALRKRIGVVNPVVDAGAMHTAGAVVDAELTALEAVATGFFATVGLYDIPTHDQWARAEQVLKQVGLAQRLTHRYGLLSSGEQRRCLMARALVHQPELLILDEPTAGLDIAGREQVLATIERIMAQPGVPGVVPPTVLMITHHIEEISPRTALVLLMKQGRIIAGGPPREVITPESLTQTFGCKVFVKRTHGRWWLEVLPEAWLELLRPGQ